MILHIDMDAFYASVEQRDQPELRDKPVIVGGSANGRGVVSAASYEARKFGVHSAMPTRRALQLCPHAIVLKTRMSVYADVSRKIRKIFGRYTPEIEPLSLDEAFLDVTGVEQLFGSAEEIGLAIKREIYDELELIASVGVAPNKFLAKLASDLEKPNGFTVIDEDRILETLEPLPVSRLWGVGKVTERKLLDAHISTFGDLQRLNLEQTQGLFGNLGEHFWKLARGKDSRRVVTDRDARTISHETTFFRDVTDIDILLARLLDLTEQVGSRLRASSLLGKTIQLKVRYSDFHTITRSRSLPKPTNSTELLWQVVSDLMTNQLPKRALVVRLVGMGVSNLESPKPKQLDLFGESQTDEPSKIDSATDAIRKQFGHGSLKRASTLNRKSDS